MKLTASLLLGLVAGTTAASSTELKSMVAKKLKIDLLKTQLDTALASITDSKYGSNSSTKENQESVDAVHDLCVAACNGSTLCCTCDQNGARAGLSSSSSCLSLAHLLAPSD